MGIAVLGPLAVDGAVGSLRHHDRVVLTVLAMRPGEPVSAERLADALWSESVPATWSKVVQGCVVRLRKVLGTEAIETTPQGYRLALLPDEIDSLRFERLVGRGRALLALAEPDRAGHVLAEAVGLWRGEAFADIDGWAGGQGEAARLEELRRSAEELEVDAALRSGRCHEVLDRAQQLTDAMPLREHRWALLALAHYLCGGQGEALQALRAARRVLAGELGIDPGAELVALEEAILRQDPSLLVRPVEATTATCPYRGMVPFGVADDELFFGRESELQECLRRLATGRVLAVVGPTGSGKSSLVRAGVAAALARTGRSVRVVTPGPHPMDVVDGLTAHRSPPALVVDQCEEAVTLCDSSSERAAFFDGLLAHAEQAPLVLAVRADQLGALSTYAAAAALLEQGLFLLRPMEPEQLRACIERPAAETGLLVEPGLTDLLLTELEDEPGALPLLSHTLRETWIQREGRTLTVAGYRRSGGLQKAVARTAEEVYDAVPEPHRPLLRSLLMRLVTEAPDGQLVRARVPRAQVIGPDQQWIVERLVDARLVVSDGEDLQLAHEALIRAWPRLQQWLVDDVEDRRILQHLSTAAQAWEALGRPDSELYRGVRLAQALDWRQQTAPHLTTAEREFLDTSQALVDAELRDARRRVELEREARRRTRRLAVGLAAVLALALVAAGSATWFQQAASDRAVEAAAASTEADANRLAALSDSVRGIDLSLLLAAQAFRTADTPATRDGLLSALLDHARAEHVVGVDNVVPSGALANRGRTLFLNGHSQLYSWEVGSDEPPRVILRWGTKVDFVAGAPTDDLVALWQYRADGTPAVGVFDSRGRELLLLEGTEEIGGQPMGFGFTPDSRRLYLDVVVADGPGPYGVRLHEYELATGELLRDELVRRRPGPGQYLFTMMSDDGTWSVSWPQDDPRSPVLVENRTGRRMRLTVGERPADPTWWFPVSTGATLVWADGAVSVYDATGRETQVLDAHRAEVTDVQVSSDGTWAATADRTGVVTLWDIDRASGTWTPREVLPGVEGRTNLSADTEGSTLVTTGSDGTVVLWDLADDAGLGSAFPGLGPRGWVSNSPAEVVPGRLLVAPTRDGRAAEWWSQNEVSATFFDPRTGEVVDQVFAGRIVEAIIGSSASVSPDRSLVAVTYQAGTVVLDAHTREVVARIRLDPPAGSKFPENVWCTAWTPDGSRLLLCADGIDTDAEDGNLVMVDTTTWEVAERRVRVGGAVQTAELSPDGRLLAVGMVVPFADDTAPASVKLLDSESLQVLREVELGPDQMALDVTFSRDGRRLAVAGITGLLSVIDVEAGALVHHVQVHTRIEQVEWLPDNRTVVSTGPDTQVVLYDADRALVRARMPVTVRDVEAQAFLLRAGDGEVSAVVRGLPGRTYPLDPQVWLDRACAVAGRDLTRDEWSSYLPGRPYERTCSDRT